MLFPCKMFVPRFRKYGSSREAKLRRPMSKASTEDISAEGEVITVATFCLVGTGTGEHEKQEILPGETLKIKNKALIVLMREGKAGCITPILQTGGK